MTRLQCPYCHSFDTWTTYIHRCHSDGAAEALKQDALAETDGPPPANMPFMTEWTIPAEGPEVDGTPHDRQCPGCNVDGVPASYVACETCGYQW